MLMNTLQLIVGRTFPEDEGGGCIAVVAQACLSLTHDGVHINIIRARLESFTAFWPYYVGVVAVPWASHSAACRRHRRSPWP